MLLGTPDECGRFRVEIYWTACTLQMETASSKRELWTAVAHQYSFEKRRSRCSYPVGGSDTTLDAVLTGLSCSSHKRAETKKVLK